MQKTTRPQRRPPMTVPKERTVHDAELVDEMDALLEEIDGILEENASEVLVRFRQKGGE